MDREAELDAFKQLDLSAIASRYGYEIVRQKSTRHSILMKSSFDKIVISRQGNHYVYFSVHDPVSAGTILDFTQRVIEPGCSLGRVRQLLRPYLGGSLRPSPQTQHHDNSPTTISPRVLDRDGVAARYAQLSPIDQPPQYLCQTRAIPFDLLQSKRLAGRVRHCPRRGSIVFPHWDTMQAFSDSTLPVTGYEIKGRGVNLFSTGGQKSLWMSTGFPEDRVLAVGESGLDCLSYLAQRDEEGIRICSLSGQMNARQPELIHEAIGEMNPGSQVVAAFDNDPAGDRLTARLQALVSESNRSDLTFRDDRPAQRGYDWNRVVMEQRCPAQTLSIPKPTIGR